MVETGKVAQLNLLLDRVIDLSKQGWYSGDTHIHLDRRTRDDDERCLDLAAAEDIRFAHILCMNDPRTYQPLMEQQLHPQMRGMGKESVVQRGNYQIASGQEYRANTYGHICLVGGRRLVDAEGMKTDPNLWPPFGEVADELHSLGGYAFHAHGGYGKEIYADFAQRATDGVELLQFAEYRDIGLEGWYHILNAGYRFPAVGASDYPYCRALGDCRTYCYLPDGEPTFEDWDRAAAAGRSFFTTGPLLLLTVNDKQRPGDTIELPAGEQSLDVEISIYSPTVPIGEWQLIEGGIVRQRREMDARRSSQPLGRRRARWSERLTVRSSTWIAARVWGKSESGRVDVEAHTNPIYIRVGDTSPVQPASVEWLLKKLDERIAANAAREFPQKERLLSYMQRSRRALQELRGR
jgi:hypothetical protein